MPLYLLSLSQIARCSWSTLSRVYCQSAPDAEAAWPWTESDVQDFHAGRRRDGTNNPISQGSGISMRNQYCPDVKGCSHDNWLI